MTARIIRINFIKFKLIQFQLNQNLKQNNLEDHFVTLWSKTDVPKRFSFFRKLKKTLVLWIFIQVLFFKSLPGYEALLFSANPDNRRSFATGCLFKCQMSGPSSGFRRCSGSGASVVAVEKVVGVHPLIFICREVVFSLFHFNLSGRRFVHNGNSGSLSTTLKVQ